MKNITLSVPDNKFNYFLNLIDKLGYVKVLTKDSIIEIPKGHEEIVAKRLEEHNQNPQLGEDWEDVKKQLDKLV